MTLSFENWWAVAQQDVLHWSLRLLAAFAIFFIGRWVAHKLVRALTHVIDKIQTHSQQRRTTVVLITDGQVGNEEQIHKAIAGSGAFSLHCFGIDTTVNDAFLKRLAREHGSQALPNLLHHHGQSMIGVSK